MIVLLATLALVAGTGSPSSGEVLPTVHAAITLHLHASADRAFPMFDPVNESRWDPDWQPTLPGDARIASGLVFTTQDESERAAWLLDRYDASLHVIRYVTVHSATLTTIDITVEPIDADSSVATVRYTRTALDSRGVANIRHFELHFPSQGPHWENAITAALETDNGR